MPVAISTFAPAEGATPPTQLVPLDHVFVVERFPPFHSTVWACAEVRPRNARRTHANVRAGKRKLFEFIGGWRRGEIGWEESLRPSISARPNLRLSA